VKLLAVSVVVEEVVGVVACRLLLEVGGG